MSYTLRDGLQSGSIPAHNSKNIFIPATPASQNHPGTNSIISDSESKQLSCGICTRNLEDLSFPQREEHYERHFLAEAQDSSLEEPDIVCLTPSKKINSSGGFKKPSPIKDWARNLKRSRGNDSDTFWYTAQATAPPSNYTPGLIPLLKKSLWNSHAQGSTCRATLCYERSVHISREFWDTGWGCGYRNFLMACAALMDQSLQPLYFPLLDSPTGPGIRNLQAWIEDAWKDGFDPYGAKELKKLVGTRKWIGTSDLWVAFSSRGIPAELVDFDLKNQPTGFKVVTDWIIDYFSPKSTPNKSASVNEALRGASPIVVTDRMPLILQHNGHSRTIVGYEVSNKGHVRLLTFDPAHVLDKNTRNAAISFHSSSPRPGHPSSSAIQQSQKRRLASSSSGSVPPNATKRSRYAAPSNAPDTDDDEVIIVSDSRECQQQKQSSSGNDISDSVSTQVLNRLRLDAKKFGKKQYQILYFPMTAPLTRLERIQRKEVISTKAC